MSFINSYANALFRVYAAGSLNDFGRVTWNMSTGTSPKKCRYSRGVTFREGTDAGGVDAVVMLCSATEAPNVDDLVELKSLVGSVSYGFFHVTGVDAGELLGDASNVKRVIGVWNTTVYENQP